jgi:energy-coupling factor transporter ATP-binding protein EcfA2
MAEGTTAGEVRLDVFLKDPREVFQSVERRYQIWREDPFDVESVHEQARTQFQRLLAQATTPPGTDAGRVLLLLGSSGSGKTHLMRSFRNYVHINGRGFVGYMQMTTSVSNYGRYILSNLIDSLDQPYYESLGPTSGLVRLSKVIAKSCRDQEVIKLLREDEDLAPAEVTKLVSRAADNLVSQPQYANVDLDLVRALLFLQRNSPALKKRVIKYLRCEDLSSEDQKVLDLSPRLAEEDAQQLIGQIGRLIWSFAARALVICVDQLEDMADLEGSAEIRFRRAMAALCAIADQVPSSIIVISCLEDYYDKLRGRLTRSTLDRIENDPPKVHLVTERSAEEVEKIVEKRLGYLYETSAAKLTPDDYADPLYPIPRELLGALSGLRTRDVLNECRAYREACVMAGRLVEPPPPDAMDKKRAGQPEQSCETENIAKTKLEQAWNDYLNQYNRELSDSDADLAELLGWAIRACAEELESGHRFDVHMKDGMIDVRVMVPVPNGKPRLGEEIFVVLCNKAPQGGGLALQIERAVSRAEERVLALIRWGEFPSNPKTLATRNLSEAIKSGARQAVIEDSDWRTISAFREFRQAHAQDRHFKAWLMEENHLSRLLPLIHVLDLDHLDRFNAPPAAPPAALPAAPPAAGANHREWTPPAQAAPSPPERDVPQTMRVGEAPPAPRERPSSSGGRSLQIGVTSELVPKPVTLNLEALCAHSAFLGSTGSGKTTLALNLIEQILLCGVPALLIDRKGDLCAYAREAAWDREHPDPELEQRRRALRDQVDVALYTPGHPGGRPLAISLVPQGLSALKDFDREEAARFAAEALGDMLGYKQTRRDKSLRAILVQAFRLFAVQDNLDKLDLETLISFIANEDRSLVVAVGRLDVKLFKSLVNDLETLKLSAAALLSPSEEKLDAEQLFGLGPRARAGRTRVSIVSTKFLGDNARILFWVSQLLLALTRWVTRSPSPHLQAVVLFDEADVYLPAQSQPATKGPMENLLRRARSAGMGIMLATKSPADLDYKCRDNIRSWFVGRVTQPVALEKMRPLLSEARVNVTARIPGQGAGHFHLLQDGRVTGFRGQRSFLQAEQVPEAEILTLAARRCAIR